MPRLDLSLNILASTPNLLCDIFSTLLSGCNFLEIHKHLYQNFSLHTSSEDSNKQL